MAQLSRFAEPITDAWGNITYMLTERALFFVVAAIFFLLLLSSLIPARNGRSRVIQLSFTSITIAAAFIASRIHLIHMPMGGSVTLFGMLILSLIGYWYGTVQGILVATAYSMLELLLYPYILNIPQVLLDYILAFGALGLSGLFSDDPDRGLLKGFLTAVSARYVCAVLSGVLFFADYALEQGYSSPLVYSLVYNGTYLGGEALLTIALLSIPRVRKALDSLRSLALAKTVLVIRRDASGVPRIYITEEDFGG